jgi:hypothetical protein
MFNLLENRVVDSFAARIRVFYGVAVPVLTEQPKQTSFGEIAVPAAFQLARQLKKAPRAIAQELVAAMGPIEGVTCALRISDTRIFDDCQRSYRANRMVAHAPQTAATITLYFVLFLINTASFLYLYTTRRRKFLEWRRELMNSRCATPHFTRNFNDAR